MHPCVRATRAPSLHRGAASFATAHLQGVEKIGIVLVITEERVNLNSAPAARMIIEKLALATAAM